jgi:diacylglycerol O-acyltransferase / wax synthase
MVQLTATDAAFLYLETPVTPMHVGSMHLIELPASRSKDRAKAYVENVRKHIKARLHLAPVFTRRLAVTAMDFNTPSWISDGTADLEYHIRHVTLPAPGTLDQLEQFVASLHSRVMDRAKPMWEFYFVSGLAQDDAKSPLADHIALYSKIHHAALDGQGAVAFAQVILDVTPEGRPVPPPSEKASKPKAAAAKPKASNVWAGATDLAGQYASMVRSLPTMMGNALSAVQQVGQTLASLQAKKMSNEGLGNSLDDEPVQVASATAGFDAHLVGPKTHFNATIGAERSFATTTLALAHIKQVGAAMGGTVNDVVLLLCSTALREYLAKHGNRPDQPLIAAVPLSLRSSGDSSANNQVIILPVSLASHIADMSERLTAIQASSERVKSLVSMLKSGAGSKMKLPTMGMPWLIRSLNTLYSRTRMADVIPPIANLIISNVPGPQIPLYFAGALVKSFYPLSIPVHGLGLNVTVQSYNGRVDVGITAAKSAVPDARLVADLIARALSDLLSQHSDERPTEVKKTARKSMKKVAPAPTRKPRVAAKTVAAKTATKKATKGG